MDLSEELKIIKFDKSLSSRTLENLYFLNQENTPEVGSIKSFESFVSLINISSLNLLVQFKNQPIGFVICFRENSDYKSPNYKYFNQKKEKFLYIDRVVIKSGFRRNGLGTRVYEFIKRTASKELLPICCEVNSDPPNDISIKFHIKNGFKKIGKKEFADHSVIYFIK